MNKNLFIFLLVLILFFSCAPEEKDDDDDAPSGDGVDILEQHTTAIKVDSKQRIHIAYNLKDTLYYACKENDQWTIEEVDSFYITSGLPRVRLVLDSENRPHIIVNKDFEGLFYGTKNDSGWVAEYFDKLDEEGISFFDLVIDSKDRIKIIYPYDDSIFILYQSGQEWKKEKIINDFPNENDFEWLTANIDSADAFHISFVGTNYKLYYLTNKTGQWITENIDPEIKSNFNSIAVDSGDHVYIAYEVGLEKLLLASNLTGEWLSELVFLDEGAYGESEGINRINLALDSDNNPHILFSRELGNGLSVASKEEEQWTIENIALSLTEYSEDLTVAPDDSVHLTYANSNSEIIHKTNATGSWKREVVDKIE